MVRNEMNRVARLAGPAGRVGEGPVVLRFGIRSFNRVRCRLETGNSIQATRGAPAYFPSPCGRGPGGGVASTGRGRDTRVHATQAMNPPSGQQHYVAVEPQKTS